MSPPEEEPPAPAGEEEEDDDDMFTVTAAEPPAKLGAGMSPAYKHQFAAPSTEEHKSRKKPNSKGPSEGKNLSIQQIHCTNPKPKHYIGLF